MQTSISDIKLLLAQFRIVQEESPAEVIDRLVSLRQELVGNKRHMVTSLTEHLWEERLITPFPTIPYGIEREHVLKDKTRQIPR